VGAWLAPARDSKWILPVAFALLIPGILLFLEFHGPLYVREYYSELFYPPTTAYVVLALAVMGLCLKLVDRLAAARALRPLACMGQCSLAMYVLHLVLIEFALVPYLPKQGLIGFSIVYLALILLLVAAAYGIRQVKQVWPRRRWLLQFVLGA
jgi:peptidoglycan/LPS O-acetylase OafA/YrhL